MIKHRNTVMEALKEKLVQQIEIEGRALTYSHNYISWKTYLVRLFLSLNGTIYSQKI